MILQTQYLAYKVTYSIVLLQYMYVVWLENLVGELLNLAVWWSTLINCSGDFGPIQPPNLIPANISGYTV